MLLEQCEHISGDENEMQDPAVCSVHIEGRHVVITTLEPYTSSSVRIAFEC